MGFDPQNGGKYGQKQGGIGLGMGKHCFGVKKSKTVDKSVIGTLSVVKRDFFVLGG